MCKNTNCMENKRCPKCGQEDELVVYAGMWVALRDDGTDPFADSTRHMGGVDYAHSSPTVCPACGYTGILNTWTATKAGLSTTQS